MILFSKIGDHRRPILKFVPLDVSRCTKFSKHTATVGNGFLGGCLRSRHLTFQPDTVSPTAFGALATVIPLDEMDPIFDWV